MTYQTIKRLQREHGYAGMQELIDNGSVWLMEGSMGREAMALLESGACMLPLKTFKDYWGNLVPSRLYVEDGTKGSFKNSIAFYSRLLES